MCAFYIKGFCSAGDNCTFAHGTDELGQSVLVMDVGDTDKGDKGSDKGDKDERDKDSDEGICVFCHEEFSGYGNSAEPLKTGKCCADCNYRIVVPGGMTLFRNTDKGYKDKDEDDQDERDKDSDDDDQDVRDKDFGDTDKGDKDSDDDKDEQDKDTDKGDKDEDDEDETPDNDDDDNDPKDMY